MGRQGRATVSQKGPTGDNRIMEKVGLLKKACIILLVICMATAIAAPAQTFASLFSFDEVSISCSS
jgi:hypothetical protein